MSKEVQQFLDIVRSVPVKVSEPRKHFCQGCGKDTKHVYLNTSTVGRRERYQCCVCGLIHEVAV